MADPAYNGGGLIGFDETTTGGNTNSGNNSSTPNPPKSPPPPIPTPPKQSNPPQPKPQKTILDELSSVSKPITPSKKTTSKNIREELDDGEILKQVVGDFEEKGSIRLSGEYPQNYVDIPKYDLSKINVIDDDEVNFDFILCLKDGADSIPKLFSTKLFYDTLISEYNKNQPFGVNDIIEEKNIVVIDIKPIKEKVENLRTKELLIKLGSTSDGEQYVEVIRNLFVHSNYQTDGENGLKANPTYTDIELLRYISWVVSKPAKNYNERLLDVSELGEFTKYKLLADDDEPSNQIDNESDEDGNPADPSPLYPPIGRKGLDDLDIAFYNDERYSWNEQEQKWEPINDNGGGGSGGNFNGPGRD